MPPAAQNHTGRPALAEYARALIAGPMVELARRALSLHRATALVRSLSVRTDRSPDARALLRRAIASVDARFPGGGNCFRRSLMEIALDARAASEPLYAGLRSGGGHQSGHAWLASHSPPPDAYDAVLTI